MTHFGAICNPGTSHMMLMVSLGHELQKRGHRFTLFALPERAEMVERHGISFWPLDNAREYMPSLEVFFDTVGTRKGGSWREIKEIGLGEIALYCEEAPKAMKAAGIECLIGDQVIVAGRTVAERLNLPFITMCAALPIRTGSDVPPHFSYWPYSRSLWARSRNQFAHTVFQWFSTPFSRRLNTYRHQWGLAPHRRIDDTSSTLAQITQLVREFDFPFENPPSILHYVGPYQRSDARPDDFPYERLDGRPLIFAVLGTHLGATPGIWKTIAESCLGLDAQLVISLGGTGSPDDHRDLPGNPVVVSFAPQRELLKRVALMITHGGLNSVMETLAEGVPLIALPSTTDQPGVATRVVKSGAGELLPLKGCWAEALKPIVRRVYTDPSYRMKASSLQKAIRATRGIEEAAEIIERISRKALPDVP
jgi:zeaxanthin glucosyltransferase